MWWKSSSIQSKKQQQTLELKTNKTKQKTKKPQQNDEHSKTQLKPTDSNRMVTVGTVKKSWKNAVLAKYAANYWLTYDKSGKHATNFKCLL